VPTSKFQQKVAAYHKDLASSGHHGGHDMYQFHFQWHQVNRDPVRPARPDARWAADLVFGTNFLQMHHEMVKAGDDEPRQHMMHASIASWFTSHQVALPPAWNPLTPIPADLGYDPDPSVYPETIRSLLADRARQSGVTVEALLKRKTDTPAFVLPAWATREGVPAGQPGEPVTGARKLADFVNANQLGCCLVYPHNEWHRTIGGAMGSTATAIADPIFYFGVHWHIDRVFDEFKLIQSERAVRGHDVRSLSPAAVATPLEARALAREFTPDQLERFEEERRLSAALHALPRGEPPARVMVSGAANPNAAAMVAARAANHPARRGVQELMEVPANKHDKAWLQEALQSAIQLEMSTIPPYLCASWSVINRADPVARTLKQIAVEEMVHMGLAANLLSAVGGTPKINALGVVPTYPNEMPGGVHPGLMISLQGLNRDSLTTFMEIEKPDFTPIVTALHLGETYATIGAFYQAIEAAFAALQPGDVTGAKQVAIAGVTAVTDVASAVAAIRKIREEGEGTPQVPGTPFASTPGTKLAHYYRFGEIYHGKRAVQTPEGWKYRGEPVLFPETYPVAVVPKGGYAESLEFDKLYTRMLGLLQEAWTNGDRGPVSDAIDIMRGEMGDAGRALAAKPLPQGGGNYCASFVLVP